VYGKDGRTGYPGRLSEGGIDMKRRALYYFLSAATVYVTMSYMLNAFVALFTNFGLTVI
jgi:hypothetical protein